MYWAMKELIKQNRNIDMVAETSVGVITAMYYYYLELYEKYDVSKILGWSKKIKEVFDMYKDKYIKQYKVNYFLNTKEREYANVDLKKVITFDEFLRKIEEV